MNPFTRILAGIVGVLALVGVFFFGVFIFLFFIVAGLLAWLAFRIRLWWLRRKMVAGGFSPEQANPFMRGGPNQGREQDSDAIDAEYEVVSRKEDD